MIRSRLLSRAKQHFFMDAAMHECTEPVSDEDVRIGAGTKIVVTIGPACQSVEMMSEMLLAGVNCARLDLTWGSMEFHRTSLRNLGAAMRATKRLCAVWVDTVGREIVVRMPATGDCNGWLTLEKTPIRFEEGQDVVITIDPVANASSSLLPVSNPAFPSLVQPGNILHVGRFLATGAEGGSLFLKVQSATASEVRCVAQNTANLVGVLTVLVSHRQFSLSTHDHDLNRDLPLMCEHDITCLTTFAADYEIDFLTLSYCNSAEDVWTARQTLDQLGMTQTKIMAKVERKAAIHNFDDIVAAADGILFSRGNLGLDFEPEEMALLQKACVLRCNNVGKPIVLTRFVDTMVNTPRPTRAEATDVANAVLDGVDGVLLGAETLRGAYPVDTVKTVVRLCRAAEHYFDYRTHHEDMMGEAFEEEVSLERAHPSVADLAHADKSHNQHHSHPSHHHAMPPLLRPVVTVGSSPEDSDSEIHVIGSPGNGFSSSPFIPASRAAGLARRVSSFGVLPPARPSSEEHLAKIRDSGAPYMSKVESIASSAVRTAEKINAGLLVVLAQTGRTVSLVAKYRPPMPVLAVVVPTLRSSNLGWQLEGKFLARQSLVLRGVRPMLAAPMAEGGEGLLGEAIAAAHQQGLVKPNDYVVCILSQTGTLVVKVVQCNAAGTGIALAKPISSLGGHTALTMPSRSDTLAAAAAAAATIVGTPPSPGFLHRTSMSMKGAGTLGGGRSPLVQGTGLVPSLSELEESGKQ